MSYAQKSTIFSQNDFVQGGNYTFLFEVFLDFITYFYIYQMV